MTLSPLPCVLGLIAALAAGPAPPPELSSLLSKAACKPYDCKPRHASPSVPESGAHPDSAEPDEVISAVPADDPNAPVRQPARRQDNGE